MVNICRLQSGHSILVSASRHVTNEPGSHHRVLNQTLSMSISFFLFVFMIQFPYFFTFCTLCFHLPLNTHSFYTVLLFTKTLCNTCIRTEWLGHIIVDLLVCLYGWMEIYIIIYKRRDVSIASYRHINHVLAYLWQVTLFYCLGSILNTYFFQETRNEAIAEMTQSLLERFTLFFFFVFNVISHAFQLYNSYHLSWTCSYVL